MKPLKSHIEKMRIGATYYEILLLEPLQEKYEALKTFPMEKLFNTYTL